MALMINTTQCCGIREIYKLGEHKGDGLGALKAFCKTTMPMVGDPSYARYGNAARNGSHYLYTFYWFSEALSHDGKLAHNPWVPGNKELYGKAFSEVIKELGLGEIMESPIKPNYQFHPDHSVKVYFWAPDREKVAAWWAENNDHAIAKRANEAKAAQEAAALIEKLQAPPPIKVEEVAEKVAQDIIAEANSVKIRKRAVVRKKRVAKVSEESEESVAIPGHYAPYADYINVISAASSIANPIDYNYTNVTRYDNVAGPEYWYNPNEIK